MQNTVSEPKARKSFVSRFLLSDTLKIFMLALAVIFVLLDKFVLGTLVFVVISSLVLLVPESHLHSLFPLLLLCSIAIRCYASFDTFIVYWWIALLPLIVLLIKLITFIKKAKTGRLFDLGKSFYGNLAVAFAVTLGGVGSISLSDYFSPITLYYTVFLGFGMIFFYIVARQSFSLNCEDIFSTFCKIMYLTGIFCSFSVFYVFAEKLPEFIAAGKPIFSFIYFQWSNNCATLLLFCLPFPFFYSKKNCLHFISGIFMFFALMMTFSRAAFIFAPVEFLICVIYAIHYNKKNLLSLAAVLSFFALSLFAISRLNTVLKTPVSLFSGSIKGSLSQLISKDESRIKMLFRSIEDFSSSPIFGKGLGNNANSDLYNPQKGAMHWYHMMIPQVIGSLGSIGILAYGYQFVLRIGLIFRKANAFKLCLGVSYMGILLMSQVNPGEFCPLPYELLTVIIFILLEKSTENQN